MSAESVRTYLLKYGKADDIMEFSDSSATVFLAARALKVFDPVRFGNVEPCHIAKTMGFILKSGACVLVVTAGDTVIDNKKFKALFGCKAKMIPEEQVPSLTGHPVGGVCPFANPEGTKVYLDLSLLRFRTVFPACGSPNTAIPLSPDELFLISNAFTWADLCNIKEQE